MAPAVGIGLHGEERFPGGSKRNSHDRFFLEGFGETSIVFQSAAELILVQKHVLYP